MSILIALALAPFEPDVAVQASHMPVTGGTHMIPSLNS